MCLCFTKYFKSRNTLKAEIIWTLNSLINELSVGANDEFPDIKTASSFITVRTKIMDLFHTSNLCC